MHSRIGKASADINQGENFSDDFWAKLRIETKKETPKPQHVSRQGSFGNDEGKELLTQPSFDARKTPKTNTVVERDEDKKPVVILAFDEDDKTDLKNPFAKKPSLASRHKSLLEQKKTPESKKVTPPIATTV